MSDFYMTLLSNSSMNQYYSTKNTTSSFVVQLPRYIQLEGEWEVALAEIQYPYTFFTVSEGHNEIEVETVVATDEYIKWQMTPNRDETKKFPTEKRTYKISTGFYSNVKDIIARINSIIEPGIDLKNLFVYDERVKTVIATVTKGKKWITSCKLQGRLGLQLCYSPDDNSNVLHKVYARHVSNLNMGVPDKMLIYCDIVEPQVIGDTWAKVLRTVNPQPESGVAYFGRPCYVVFNPLQYIPLQMKHFESINIDIRDGEGKLMPFQYGTSTVKLHFRRKK